MNQPTQFDIEAEKILLEFAGGYFMSTPGERHLKRQAALAQLHNLYVQGKIDEFKALYNDTSNNPEWPKNYNFSRKEFTDAINNRLAILTTQLNLNGGNDE